jgi:hypothetical protein
MTQIAASIEYETIPRPSGLPNDMQPLPDAFCSSYRSRRSTG